MACLDRRWHVKIQILADTLTLYEEIVLDSY